MTTKVLRNLVLPLALLVPMAASATVIDFQNGPGGTAVGSAYAGSGVIFTNTYYSNCYGSYWAAGENNTCYNNNINATVSGYFLGTTDYLGASIMYPDVSTQTILSVYDINNVLLTTVTSAQHASFISVSVAGIASFAFNWVADPGADDVIGIDDLVFNTVSPVTTPEPAALSLFGLALAALGLRRRAV